MVIFLDIETSGLDSFSNRIYTVGLLHEEQHEPILLMDRDEGKILADFSEFVKNHREDVYVGFNISRFDIPFIRVRMLKHSLDLRITNDMKILDLSTILNGILSQGRPRTVFRSQEQWLKFFMLENNDKYFGAQMPDLYDSGDYEKIKQHCIFDLTNCRKIYNILKRCGVV
jgi:uncharacterized protein YprB with RNaseH-like and TPR domain